MREVRQFWGRNSPRAGETGRRHGKQGRWHGLRRGHKAGPGSIGKTRKWIQLLQQEEVLPLGQRSVAQVPLRGIRGRQEAEVPSSSSGHEVTLSCPRWHYVTKSQVAIRNELVRTQLSHQKTEHRAEMQLRDKQLIINKPQNMCQQDLYQLLFCSNITELLTNQMYQI